MTTPDNTEHALATCARHINVYGADSNIIHTTGRVFFLSVLMLNVWIAVCIITRATLRSYDPVIHHVWEYVAWVPLALVGLWAIRCLAQSIKHRSQRRAYRRASNTLTDQQLDSLIKSRRAVHAQSLMDTHQQQHHTHILLGKSLFKSALPVTLAMALHHIFGHTFYATAHGSGDILMWAILVIFYLNVLSSCVALGHVCFALTRTWSLKNRENFFKKFVHSTTSVRHKAHGTHGALSMHMPEPRHGDITLSDSPPRTT
jgi:hypothetical protein